MKGKRKMASFSSISLLSPSHPAALPRSAHVSQSSNSGLTAASVYIDVHMFPNSCLAKTCMQMYRLWPEIWNCAGVNSRHADTFTLRY